MKSPGATSLRLKRYLGSILVARASSACKNGCKAQPCAPLVSVVEAELVCRGCAYGGGAAYPLREQVEHLAAHGQVGD